MFGFDKVTPKVIIKVDGERALKLERRLVSVEVTDAAGMEGDKALLKLTNTKLDIELPEDGQRFEVAFAYGFEVPLTLGIYTVERISGRGNPHMITIEGHAAPLSSSIRSPHTRTHKRVTIEDLVGLIASEHGFKPAVAPELGSVFFAHIAQTAESDLHLLTRLASELDAIAKPVEEQLLFIKRGSKTTVSGEEIVPITVPMTKMHSYAWTRTARKNVKSVEAQYIDPKSGKNETVSVGEGDPKLTLRHVYPDKARAEKAIEAAADKNWRAYQTWNCTLATFWGDLFVGAIIDLVDVQAEFIGKWTVCKSVHSANGGSFVGTKIETERLIE